MLWIAGGTLALLGLLAAGYWWFVVRPIYVPGRLAAHPQLEPAGSDASGPWRVAEGIELSHFGRGKGRPVLYLHGGPGAAPTRSIPGLELLEDQFRIHYYAQRGTGESTRPIRGFASRDTGHNIQTLVGALGIGEQVADIERIRRILGEERLLLVGHSYGGFLAALYAAEFPDRVEALVLLAPADLLRLPSPHEDLFEGLRARLPAERHAEFDAWRDRYLDLASCFGKREAELEALDRQLLEYWEEAVGPLPPTVVAGTAAPGAWMVRAQYLSMGMRHDYTPALAGVRSRTLILHGAADLQPAAAAEAYRDAISGARLVTVEGAGHFLHHTHPQAVAAALREALAAP